VHTAVDQHFQIVKSQVNPEQGAAWSSDVTVRYDCELSGVILGFRASRDTGPYY
jgi:hypothetical protein